MYYKKSTIAVITAHLIFLITTSCAPITASQFSSGQLKKIIDESPQTNRAKCEIYRPDYVIDTKITSFEATDKAGLHFGMAKVANFGIDVDFQMNWAKLSLVMNPMDPLNPTLPLASLRDQATEKHFKLAAILSFNMFNVGANFDHTGALADLATKAMLKTLNDVLDWENKSTKPWSAKVLAAPDAQHIVMNAGLDSGIRTGDQFAVFNTTDTWDSEGPCKGKFLYETTSEQLATYTAKATGNIDHKYTILTADASPLTAVLPGAKVMLVKLFAETGKKPTPRSPLKKQLRIGKFQAAPIALMKDSVDFTYFFKNQIGAAFTNSGFALSDDNQF